MPFIIPNAGDTGGNPYLALDQAEPDSLDFEILGHRGNGVISGCAVTPASPASATSVVVSSGTVVLHGVPYAVAGDTFSVGTAPQDKRFDLVVARVAAGAATLQVVQGVNSSTNPTYLKSKSIDAAGIDLNTDVVLAALYRVGGSSILAVNIVDKRTPIYSSIVDQGTANPASNRPDTGTGSLYMRTDIAVMSGGTIEQRAAAGATTGSGVWVKTSTGAFMELAQSSAHLGGPIGGSVVWPSVQPPPDGWIECNGQSLSRTTYAALFAVLGTTWGSSSGSTFKVPNWNHLFLRGTTSTGEVGQSVGADSATSPLPTHSHGMKSHTHTLAHTHSGTTAGANARHYHYSQRGQADPREYFVTQLLTPGGPSALQTGPGAGAYINNDPVTGADLPDHGHSYTTQSQSTSTTQPPNDNTTDPAGVGSGSVATIPASAHVRWVIRASLG